MRASTAAILYVATAAASRAAPFFLLPIYAYVLSPSELAAYGVGASLAQVLAILSDGGLSSGLTRSFFDLDPEVDRSAYFFKVGAISRVVSLLFLTAIVAPISFGWDRMFDPDIPFWPTLLLILANSFFRRSNTLTGTFFRLQENHLGYTISQLLPPILQIIFGLSLVMLLHMGFLGAMLTIPLGFGCALLVNVFRVSGAAKGHYELTWPELREVFALGLSAIPDQLSRWGQQLAFRVFLAIFSTTMQAATFVFASSPSQLFTPVIDGVQLFVSPVYFRAMKAGEHKRVAQLKRALSAYLGVTTIAGFAAIGTLDPVFHYLAPHHYRESGNVAAILVAAMILRGLNTMVQTQLRYAKRNGLMSMNSTISLATCYFAFIALAQGGGALSGALGAAISVYVFSLAGIILNFISCRSLEGPLLRGRDIAVSQLGLAVALVVQEVLISRDAPASLRFTADAAVAALGVVLSTLLLLWPNRAFLFGLLTSRLRRRTTPVDTVAEETTAGA